MASVFVNILMEIDECREIAEILQKKKKSFWCG